MMTPFKILRGLKTNLPSSKTDGQFYITTDQKKMYADIGNDRIILNPNYTANNGIKKEDNNFTINKTQLINMIYPVGSIYISTNSSDPSTIFGGTWQQIKGRFLLASGSNGASGNQALNKSLGTTGGSYRHQHTYGIRHGVYYGQGADSTTDSTAIQLRHYNTSNTQSWKSGSQNGERQGRYTSWSGEGNVSQFDVTASTDLVDSLPPYLTVSIWKRTA